MEEIEIQNTVEKTVDVISLVTVITPEPIEEIKTPLVRGYRGRFVIGNRESVGNKGGRPKNISLEDMLMDPERLEVLCEKAIHNGDTNSILALVDLLDGKKVSSSNW